MKILIDIGHPGHVHYFKNAIKNWIEKRHDIIVVARDREFIKDLLKSLNISYINRGAGRNSKVGKFFYMLQTDIKLIKISLNFKPDIYLSFSSPYAAQVAYLFGKPHITINDTEHTDEIHSKFTYPFSSVILTPNSYYNDLGVKHFKFNSVVENLYLHKNYFKAKIGVKLELPLKTNEEYVVLRFVSWKAHHDFGQSGLDIITKRKLINILKQKYKIFISSEGDLPEEFKEYQLTVSPDKMHDVLAFASIFIGESATMSSESVLLNTPAVYINSLPLMGYLKLEQEAGLLKHFSSSIGVIDYVEELIKTPNLKKIIKEKSINMQQDFVNTTDFLVWFIESYPKSVNIMENNPNYQLRFR